MVAGFKLGTFRQRTDCGNQHGGTGSSEVIGQAMNLVPIAA